MKKSIYIYNEGQLQRKDNTLCYTSLNGKKTDLPIETISDIYIMTELTLNTAMLNLASKYGICLHFFNYYNFYTGSFYPKETLVSGNLLVQQTQAYLDPSHRLRLAKQFVIGAGKISTVRCVTITTAVKILRSRWMKSAYCLNRQKKLWIFQP